MNIKYNGENTGQNNHNEQQCNPNKGFTRRSYLSVLSGVPAATTVLNVNQTSKVDPKKLLISQDQIPEAFNQAEVDRVNPLSAALRSSELSVSESDLASSGFWAGEDPDNPIWVLASGACTTNNQSAVDTATTVTERVSENCIREYKKETNGQWSFDLYYDQHETFHEWRADIYIDQPVFDNENNSSQPTLIDTIRLQHVNGVLLWTLLFGPTNHRWPFEQLLDRATNHQRDLVNKNSHSELELIESSR